MLRSSILILVASISLLAQKRDVAVVVSFAHESSPDAMDVMRAEAGRIVQKAGVNLSFVTSAQAAGGSFSELVVFKVSGQCEMGAFPPRADNPGPLGWTYITDQRILPFGEVQCDRLRNSLRGMIGADGEKGNRLLGRAMGRVVAHELFHILAETTGHGKAGVTKESLSPRQLVAETLDLSDHDSLVLDPGGSGAGR